MDTFLELFSFSGRANRAHYFWHILLDGFVVLGAVIILGILDLAIAPIFSLPALGIAFGAAWAALAITVKRLHDLDRPGWHIFLFWIPLYNIWLELVLLFQPGTFGPNDYGPDPLGHRSERRRVR